jgi:hypothetical protein
MWEAGLAKGRPHKDVNAEMRKLEGELSDEEAMATLAEFLFANPGLTLNLLGGMEMFPMQEIIMKGWILNNYSLTVMGRGNGKSYMAAMFCLFWALFNPRCRIVIISFAFRASRRILEQIETFVKEDENGLLKNCFPKDMNRKNDEWKWVLPNGASILCVPLGDGKKLRGIRAETVVVDERNFLSNSVLTEIISPFLASNNNIKEQLRLRRKEDLLIKQGRMTEGERAKMESDIKVINLSSAGYQFEDMYKEFCNWRGKILGTYTAKDGEDDKEVKNAKYFVSRLSYEAAPEGLINEKAIEEAKSGQTSESVFNREYRAIFTADSDSYFSAKKMKECTIEDGKSPCIEIVGTPGDEYILGIDPSFSSAEYSDYFAMVVVKLTKKGDEIVPMVVHNYMVAGGNFQDHILYLYFLLKNFNIIYISIDSSQGDNEFITSANNSQLFKNNKVNIVDIQADFKRDDQSETPKEIRQSYNKESGRIVHKQPFGGTFTKSANEHMQGCLDFKRLFFAGKLTANETEGARALDADIGMLGQHEYYKDMSVNQFIEWQDTLMDKLKQQCAMIEVSSSALGSQSWDLPLNFRRSKNPDRIRKDGYSALLLANWATKMYLASREIVEEDVPDTFTPFAI